MRKSVNVSSGKFSFGSIIKMVNEMSVLLIFEFMRSSCDEFVNEDLFHFLFSLSLQPHVSIFTLLNHEMFYLVQIALDIKFLKHIIGHLFELSLCLPEVRLLKVLLIVGHVRLTFPIEFAIRRASRLQIFVGFTKVDVELDEGFDHVLVYGLSLAILIY